LKTKRFRQRKLQYYFTVIETGKQRVYRTILLQSSSVFPLTALHS